MERKLASIERCSSVRPIEGADKIEVATVLGWECVVKKGEIKPDQLGVYIEIDSVVPDIPVFEFLRERKFRVKTIKLRGQICQGLFMPLVYFPQLVAITEGRDVTALLGITKYEPEEVKESTQPRKKAWWYYILVRIPFLRKFVIRKVGTGVAFPTNLVPKTDEPRLQTLGAGFLQTYKDLPVSITQKMDGTSLTIIWNRDKLSVCSRNMWFPVYKANIYWDFVKSLNLLPVFRSLEKHTNFAIQGELCGPGIQGNKYKLSDKVLYVYGLYDIDKRKYSTPFELTSTINMLREASHNQELLQLVPHLGEATMGAYGVTVDDWIEFATTKSSLNPETYNEGIVVRSLDNMPYGVHGMNGRRWSFKVVSPQFLLQWGV